MNRRASSVLVLGLSLCLVNNVVAGERTAGAEERIPPSAWSARVYGLGDSELEEGGASYAISSVALELQHRHWSLAVERQYFAWRHADAFPEETGGRTPWEFLNRIQLGFAHQHVHSERWMSEIMVGGATGFEDEVSDSFSGYAGGYGLYRIHPRLRLLLGLFYSRHRKVETDTDFVPLLGLIWSSGAPCGFSAQLGFPETQACWSFNGKTRLVLELSALEGGVTRLANDSPVRERGYVEFVSAAVALRLETRLGENLDVAVGVGHSVQRELKIYDADGNNRRSVDIERGPSIELAIRKPF